MNVIGNQRKALSAKSKQLLQISIGAIFIALQISNEPKAEYKEYVRNKMYEYNLMHFPIELRGRYQELNLFLIDSDGQITGGIVGEFCWNWLEIQYLFVEQEF